MYSGFSVAKRNKCYPVCPDFVWDDESQTMAEIVEENFLNPGTPDGKCFGENKEVWRFDGSTLNSPSRCVCVKKPDVPGLILRIFETRN